jgi:uncharacterized membrane protein YcfT
MSLLKSIVKKSYYKYIYIYVYVHVWSILSSTSFSALNAFAYYYFILMNFFDFRHAYPETTYITAGPAGTIGPITVSLFFYKYQYNVFYINRVCVTMFAMHRISLLMPYHLSSSDYRTVTTSIVL